MSASLRIACGSLLVALGACAHLDEGRTVDQYRAQARRARTQALILRAQHPDSAAIAEADRQWQSATQNLQEVGRLQSAVLDACGDILPAQRSACPLISPHLQAVEEVSQGVKLHLKPGAPMSALLAQMRCHLALAEADGFDRAPCPLFLRGVKVTSHADRVIEIYSFDARLAGAVRVQSRQLFGTPLVER